MRFPVNQLKTNVKALDLGDAKVWHIPDWHKMTHPQRLGIIRGLATSRGRDPRIAKLAVNVIKASGAQPREYEKQAAALLKWVQTPRNFYYVNEPGEKLQDPVYSIKVGHGDCDDAAALICALFESVRLPWKLVLSGRKDKQKIRYIEGEKVPTGVNWSHIYAMVGTPPFNPTRWYFVEPTVQNVPLGWDVIAGDKAYLPEMEGYKGPARIVAAPKARFRRGGVAPQGRLRSTAFDASMAGDFGAVNSALVGSGMAAEAMEDGTPITAKTVIRAVITGVSVSVVSALAIDVLSRLGVLRK